MAPTNILIIGATGYIGRHIALAAAAAPDVGAYALISKATAQKPERKEVLEQLRKAGVQFLEVRKLVQSCLSAMFWLIKLQDYQLDA